MNFEELLVANFAYKVSYFAKQIKGMKVVEREDAMIVHSSLPSDTFNNIVLFQSNSWLQNTILKEIDAFKKKNFPLSIWFWNRGDLKLKRDIEKSGLVDAETNVAMVKELSQTVQPQLPESFVIKVVETSSDVLKFGALVASFFGDTLEGRAVKNYYEVVASKIDMKTSKLKLFIGTANGKPVTTGSIIIAPNSIGIYDMGTSAEEQGKGFGTAMFDHLLYEASQYEKQWCVLQASEDGLSIYEKKGFKAVGEMKVFESSDL